MTDKTWIGFTTIYTVGSNWKPGITPPGPGDTAIFGSGGMSNTVDIFGVISTTADEWHFTGGAYTVNVNAGVDLQGAGVRVDPGGTALIKIGISNSFVFENASSAGSATYEMVPGSSASVQFEGHSDGGTARFIIDSSSSFVDFSGSVGPNGDDRISAGSIEGVGNFGIGTNQLLTVGGNNLPAAVVSGKILGGAGSSLTKVGTGTLTLSGNDTFHGTLTIQGGTVDLASATADSADLTVFGAGARATLRIESAALPANHFTQSVHGFAFGDTIDLPGLLFRPHASTSYNTLTHSLTVTSGAATITFADLEFAGAANRFLVLSDHNGGSEVVPAIIEHRPNKHIDAHHHPPGQPSPTHGSEVLVALGVNDTIRPPGGNDTEVGGAAGDVLYGGPGDNFVFETRRASPPSHPDTIIGFSHAKHEKIDLYDLRAFVPGDAPLVFIHGQTFGHYHHTHPSVFGMVRYAGGDLQVNLDHHLKTEFEIVMQGSPTLHASDFIL
jgi:autotransporter-associated beta strand protein